MKYVLIDESAEDVLETAPFAEIATRPDLVPL
jgi:hypothetical protein